jgi:hypothetical protein
MLFIFTLTLFLSSALIFLVEPMFAKMVLPILGSSPAVWNTSVLFFQAALLAGYAYAHASSRRLGPRGQAAVHVVLLALALLVLPLGIPDGWSPPTEGNPVGWLLALLLVGVGLPFFVISSTAPLMQRWFASSGHRRARDPYFLYRASNLGSAVGLVAYPALVEPLLRLDEQSGAWTGGYMVLVVLSAACAALLWRSTARARAEVETVAGVPAVAGGAPSEVSARRRLGWLALSAAPASLMLGVTSYLMMDISPIPLLWIIPLALYLLSFVVAFSPRAGPFLRFTYRAFPLVVLPTLLTILVGAARPLTILVPLHLVAFFVVAVACHGRLAAARPPVEHLTGFYLWLAVGGVLGGTFNALLAPLVFDSLAEYPLVLILACFLVPPPLARVPRAGWRLDLAVALGLVTLMFAANAGVDVAGLAGGPVERVLLVIVPIFVCGVFLRRPARMGMALAAVFLVTPFVGPQGNEVLYTNRTFFGIQRVEVDRRGDSHLLLHGRTLHGIQSLDPALRDEPLSYYAQSGPVGQIVEAYRSAGTVERVGVIGLGTGSMACHGQAGEAWTFYELDPEMERIARTPGLFTFLEDCPPESRVVVGDARLSLEKARDERYGLIAVDAFSSDAIPVHLITREALQLYLDRLADGGLLAFHVSNRHVDLHPVLSDLAADLGLVALGRDDLDVPAREVRAGKRPSQWVVLARDQGSIATLSADRRWYRLPSGDPGSVWTDDFSNLLGAFQW